MKNVSIILRETAKNTYQSSWHLVDWLTQAYVYIFKEKSSGRESSFVCDMENTKPNKTNIETTSSTVEKYLRILALPQIAKISIQTIS